MPIITVPDWVPDAANFGNPGAITIVNALPGLNSYKPMPAFADISTALDNYARGAIDARDKNLAAYQYCGDAEKLYRLVGTTWTDSSRVAGYASDTEEVWDMVRWKNQVLATNFSDEIQFIEMGGSAFDDLTSDFRCRLLAVIGDFVIAANTFDGTDGNVPDRVRWCGFGDETYWTVDPSVGSDVRDLKRGPIMRLYGGEYGVLLGKKAVWRMTFTGAPDWFHIDPTLDGVGSIAYGASALIGNTIFTLSEQGFVAITHGTGLEEIGAGRVDKFIFDDLDESYLYRMTCASDPKSGRVFWAYPGAGNTDGLPNRIIVYDSRLRKWSLIHQDVEHLWSAAGVGLTLEQLDTVSSDVDALPASLDSSQWKGGAGLVLAAFDSSHLHGAFNGSPMDATVDLKEVELYAGRRTHLNAFRPLVDGGTVTANVGTRNRLSDDVAWGPTLAQSASGRFTKRSNARFHRIRLNCSGEWRDVIGAEIDPADAKPGELR